MSKFNTFVTKKYKGTKTVYYLEDFIALDTETSNFEGQTWVNSIQVYFQGEYHHFRKPSELMEFYNNLIIKFQLNNYNRIVTIIHNASYDLSYLLPYIQLYLPGKEERSGIYDGKNRVKVYRQGALEFRDSLMVAGTSLERWCKDLNTQNRKQVGIYDYNKVIYQDDELTEEEKLYDKMDVVALHECYTKQMKLFDDNVATIPSTSTGYVRRDFRQASRRMKRYRELIFQHGRLDLNSYKACVNSYAGGYTHNNRFEKDRIVKGLIGHRDFRSMYPSIMRCYPLPFGKPQLIYNERSKVKMSVPEILDLYPKYSSITKLLISKVVLKDKAITMPFLQNSKMNFLKTNQLIHDNGRTLYFEGAAEVYLDNHTLKIIIDQYKVEGKILEVYAFENLYMPRCLAECIDDYFREKANWKIKVKEAIRTYGEYSEQHLEAEVNYMLSKRKLNGIYGMFATNPISDDVDFDIDQEQDGSHFILTKVNTDDQIEEKLQDYYNSRNNFLTYQVGVFITALARYELYEYITTIGYENVLYCDTDSIFYKKSDEIEKKIALLNDKKHENAEKLGAFVVDNNNSKIFYDVFEAEDDLQEFKGLHSKCYGFVTTDGIFRCTLAGIPSRTLVDKKDDQLIYVTREDELKSLDRLTDGFYFKINTGTSCIYDIHKPCIIELNGHRIETAGGGIIKKLEAKRISDIDAVDFDDKIVIGDLVC